MLVVPAYICKAGKPVATGEWPVRLLLQSRWMWRACLLKERLLLIFCLQQIAEFYNNHRGISWPWKWQTKPFDLVCLKLSMWLQSEECLTYHILNVQHSPETSMAKVSLLTPTRLKATHSTVILRLDSPTVRTLSTSTAPYSSLWTSTVGAWRGMAICSPVVFPLHLPHWNTYKPQNSLNSQISSLDAVFLTMFQSLCIATYVGRIPKHWYQMILGAGYPNEVQVSVVTFSHLTTATGLSASDKKTTGIRSERITGLLLISEVPKIGVICCHLRYIWTWNVMDALAKSLLA